MRYPLMSLCHYSMWHGCMTCVLFLDCLLLRFPFECIAEALPLGLVELLFHCLLINNYLEFGDHILYFRILIL